MEGEKKLRRKGDVAAGDVAGGGRGRPGEAMAEGVGEPLVECHVAAASRACRWSHGSHILFKKRIRGRGRGFGGNRCCMMKMEENC